MNPITHNIKETLPSYNLFFRRKEHWLLLTIPEPICGGPNILYVSFLKITPDYFPVRILLEVQVCHIGFTCLQADSCIQPLGCPHCDFLLKIALYL